MKRAVVALALLSGCAPRMSAPASTPPPRASFAEHDLKVQAAEARRQAAHEEADGAPGVFRELQLRAQNLRGSAFAGERSVTAGVVLDFERPWHMSALSRSLRAREHAEALLVDVAKLEAEALACEESARAHAVSERNTLAQRYAEQLTATLTWLEAFRAQGALDAPSLEHDVLYVRRKLLDASPSPQAYRTHEALGALPAVSESRSGALDVDIARILEGIEATHPKVHAALAEAERQGHIAVAESRSRTPWIDFVQLNVRSQQIEGRELEGRIGVGIPLDDGARGRARRAEALRLASSLEALSVARTLAWSAHAALVELATIEHNQAQFHELEAAAERATVLAGRLLEEHRGSPGDLAQLLEEALSARLAVLDARLRAALAACSLQFATGTAYDAWPRLAAPAATASEPQPQERVTPAP